jgi:hypothetical protein
MRTGDLNFEEAREALEQLYESSNEKRRFILRLYVLYAFNDKYGREGLKYLLDCEDYLYFVENCREMIKMEQTNSTLRAELYREIGEFDQCWKSPVCVTPEAQVPLTLESKFRMTPIKS